VPEPVTWYDVLGVTCGASAVTLRRAHDERLQLLRAYFAASARTASAPVQAAQTVLAPSARKPTVATPPTDAPSLVIDAASRAAAAVEAAWLVLGDSEKEERMKKEKIRKKK